MKNKHKLVVGIIVFVLALTIFSDWSNVKAGLMGKPPIEKVEK